MSFPSSFIAPGREPLYFLCNVGAINTSIGAKIHTFLHNHSLKFKFKYVPLLYRLVPTNSSVFSASIFSFNDGLFNKNAIPFFKIRE